MVEFTIFLLIILILCAVMVAFTRNILTAIIIFMAYSLIMSVIWMIIESPDLAITEAAVGAGVTSLLFFVALKRIHQLKSPEDEKEEREEKM